MNKNLRDNLAKFFYDGAKITLAVLVIGLLARPPFVLTDLLTGIFLTLIFLGIAAIIDIVKPKEA